MNNNRWAGKTNGNHDEREGGRLGSTGNSWTSRNGLLPALLLCAVGVQGAGCALEDDERVPGDEVRETQSALVSGCDAVYHWDVFRTVYSGASFNPPGPVSYVALMNGSLNDQFSYGLIRGFSRAGDRIWVDRSINRLPPPKGIVAASRVGTWKQCGPFTADGRIDFSTQKVRNDGYAVRVCFDPFDGDARCGAWYVD